MAIFDRSHISTQAEIDAEGAGVTLERIGDSILIWATMNETGKSVADCAQAFNTTPDIVRDAIGECPWLLYSGPYDDPTKQIIEVDGE